MKLIRLVSAQNHQDFIPQTVWWIQLAISALFVLPLLFFLTTPATVLIICALAIRFLALFIKKMSLSLWAIVPIFLTSCVLLGFVWKQQQGVSFVFVHFLVLMAMCKMLESRNINDIKVIFQLHWCLLFALLMYTQSPWAFLFLLLAIVANFFMLMRAMQRHSRIQSVYNRRTLAFLLLFAFPFAAVLFIFVPRINPIWRMPQIPEKQVTGLPDEMSMGDLAGLARSNEITFRVRFLNNAVPPRQKLYWRGPVLWHFDGKNWTQWGRDAYRPREPMFYQKNATVAYEWTQVKPNMHWLTLLELPIELPQKRLSIAAAWQIRLPDNAPRNYRFLAQSATEYRLAPESLTYLERKTATALPVTVDLTRTRALAKRLFDENGQNARGFAAAFLNYLTTEEFYYSLEPLAGAGNVERFLFEQRIGFCEHYAQAMAIAARTVDIPARIVLGYQGATFNPLSGDWVVREEQAHAWVELWLEGNGWTRFDPTAAVAPHRIRSGGLSSEVFAHGEDGRALSSRLAERVATIAWLRNALDAGRSFWQDWIIQMDSRQQQFLLNHLGLGAVPLGYVLAAAIAISTGILLVGYYFWQRQLSSDDAVAKMAHQLLIKLEKRGFVKAPAMPFGVFLRSMATAATKIPEKQWVDAANAYETLRYGKTTAPAQPAFVCAALRQILHAL